MTNTKNTEFPTEQLAAERNALYHYMHNKEALELMNLLLDESLFLYSEYTPVLFSVVKRLHEKNLPIDERVLEIELEKVAGNRVGLEGIVEGIFGGIHCCSIDEMPQYYDYLVEERKKHSNGPKTFTAVDLISKDFKEPVWAIPRVLPEGLTILAGKPKMGKSWMALSLSIAIATGGKALERIRVERAEALYLALEDSERRLKKRLVKLLRGAEVPESLHFQTQWPRFDDGGREELEAWIKQHPRVRLIIVDTFQKLRKVAGRSNNQYAEDYRAAGDIKQLADKYAIPIVLVHHLRKTEAEDIFDMVGGSTGLTGAVDTILVLAKRRGLADGILHITGRDVEERELALNFDANTCNWIYRGDAKEVQTTKLQQEIFDLLKENGEMQLKDIAEALDKNPSAVRKTLERMMRRSSVRQPNYGKYCLAGAREEEEALTSSSQSTQTSQSTPSSQTHPSLSKIETLTNSDVAHVKVKPPETEISGTTLTGLTTLPPEQVAEILTPNQREIIRAKNMPIEEYF